MHPNINFISLGTFHRHFSSVIIRRNECVISFQLKKYLLKSAIRILNWICGARTIRYIVGYLKADCMEVGYEGFLLKIFQLKTQVLIL